MKNLKQRKYTCKIKKMLKQCMVLVFRLGYSFVNGVSSSFNSFISTCINIFSLLLLFTVAYFMLGSGILGWPFPALSFVIASFHFLDCINQGITSGQLKILDALISRKALQLGSIYTKSSCNGAMTVRESKSI